VYVSNSDRIRLGIQGYGSDVPEEVVNAAVEALNAPQGDNSASAARAKTRARTKKGEFQGDDLATPEVNEAFIAG
jgi:hypothetical protein